MKQETIIKNRSNKLSLICTEKPSITAYLTNSEIGLYTVFNPTLAQLKVIKAWAVYYINKLEEQAPKLSISERLAYLESFSNEAQANEAVFNRSDSEVGQGLTILFVLWLLAMIFIALMVNAIFGGDTLEKFIIFFKSILPSL